MLTTMMRIPGWSWRSWGKTPGVDVDSRAARAEADVDYLYGSDHIATQLSQAREKYRFGAVLRAHQRKREGAWDLVEINGDQSPVTISNAKDRDLEPLVQHLRHDAEGFQHLKRASMHDRRARGVGAFRNLVDYHGLESSATQFGRECQTAGARAGDQNVSLRGKVRL
jgi:hypothetical protein